MTQVAILGAGPAGLLAALAVEQSGHRPTIFAKGEPSKMFGAMYLHRAIPGLHEGDSPEFEITVIKTGSREGYAYNVYGKQDAACSWEKFDSGVTFGWDLKKAYEQLWDRYERFIRPFEINDKHMGSICSNYPLVLNSIPAKSLCIRDHEFAKQDIWVVHGDGSGHLIPNVNDDNMMYYNGVPWDGSFDSDAYQAQGMEPIELGPPYMKGHDWYRFSQINKYQAWEYSREPAWAWDPEDGDGLSRFKSQGIKPLWTNCGCWMEYKSMFRIGRFGTWQKGVLTHHAYEFALEACRALQ